MQLSEPFTPIIKYLNEDFEIEINLEENENPENYFLFVSTPIRIFYVKNEKNILDEENNLIFNLGKFKFCGYYDYVLLRKENFKQELETKGRFIVQNNDIKYLNCHSLFVDIHNSSLDTSGKLKKQAIKLDEEKLTDNRLTEDNFRSQTKNDMKTTLSLSLKNEINAENTNLITYLNKEKDIKVPFIERISKFDKDKLRKLNKISQKTMFVQSQEKLINERIKDKLKVQFRNSSEKYKEGLENIRNKLFISEKIIIAEEKKIIEKKERYLNQYNEAELDWVKSGVLRFYHKNKPPVNSATSLVIDK